MSAPTIDGRRLLDRLNELGEIGRETPEGCTRLALSDADMLARNLVQSWLLEAGASVHIDQVGNIYGMIAGANNSSLIMTGSHIDTVSRAGKLDGCYGVIAGIEILQSMKDQGLQPEQSLVVAVFSNEEGVRFSPDLLGSRVIAKDIDLDDALAVESRDGKAFCSELKRIGFAGEASPWKFLPKYFIELHIEQGPVLEASGKTIGIVESVQGHSWWQVSIGGCANHAGTTPMSLRKDAGMAAMRLACLLESLAADASLPLVATVGTFSLEPNSINVVPGRARFTVDFRDTDNARLREAEILLQREASALEDQGFSVQLQNLSRAVSVPFDLDLCDRLESAAVAQGASILRMVSGASHDAQMMAKVCPTAMLFVPSISGISHNPKEKTLPGDLVMGAQLLTDVLWSLANKH
jgi:N-carbamoyl-L-amino-acid hydrolase